jgi:Gamma-glutamyl cyclotransferase, AIG2-like
VMGRGNGTVTGDLFRVGAEQMKALDEFEGISAYEVEGAEYRRVKVTAVIENTEAVSAWVYEWKGPVDEEKRIPSGDWMFHLLGQPKPFFTLLTTLPLWGATALTVMIFTGLFEEIPEEAWLAVLSFPVLGFPSVALACAYFGEQRREELRWLRSFFASISAVWLILVAFVALLGN